MSFQVLPNTDSTSQHTHIFSVPDPSETEQSKSHIFIQESQDITLGEMSSDEVLPHSHPALPDPAVIDDRETQARPIYDLPCINSTILSRPVSLDGSLVSNDLPPYQSRLELPRPSDKQNREEQDRDLEKQDPDTARPVDGESVPSDGTTRRTTWQKTRRHLLAQLILILMIIKFFVLLIYLHPTEDPSGTEIFTISWTVLWTLPGDVLILLALLMVFCVKRKLVWRMQLVVLLWSLIYLVPVLFATFGWYVGVDHCEGLTDAFEPRVVVFNFAPWRENWKNFLCSVNRS